MSIQDIFEFDQNTFLVNLRKENLSTIKEFKTLIKRDKGSPGDTQGRLKLKATREFTFIYHYCSYKSEFINYPERQRLQEALKNAELDEKTDIYADKELMEAIEVYRVLQETPALKLMTELLEGLHVSHKVIKKIRQDLERKIDEITVDEVEVEDGGKTKLVDPIVRLNERLKMIMDTARELPKTLKAITDLQEAVKKEMGEGSRLRGDSTKGTTEDPRPVQLSNPLEL